MILDKADIEKLRAEGYEVVTTNGKPFAPKPAKSELDYLRDILAALDTLAKQEKAVPPAPKVHVEAPSVIVKPPEVTVNVPPDEPRITKWRFEMKRDSNGKLSEIVATSAE